MKSVTSSLPKDEFRNGAQSIQMMVCTLSAIPYLSHGADQQVIHVLLPTAVTHVHDTCTSLTYQFAAVQNPCDPANVN